jgi:hypothetical protein
MPGLFDDVLSPSTAGSSGLFDDVLSPPKKPDQGDFLRGAKEAFQQLPQLGYGLIAGAGAAAETAFGEDGIATGIKKAGIKGYKEWGDKIQQDAKPTDSWDYSYDKAKEGDFGALVDWLQHGIGYVGGQAIQTLATGGIGAVGGKFVAGTAAKQIAEGMVKKEAARLGAENAGLAAGEQVAADAILKAATANVAGKFAAVGQSAAVGANAFGMEGGEIFGDLTSSSQGRALTGSELGKAFATTLAAGGLEFVGDKIGLDIMLGKSKLLKPTEGMKGISGRVARGGVAALGAAPIEAGTEYAQTLAEEYGKGNDPLSEASLKQARESAMLGALGGTVIGGIGGAMHGGKEAAPIAPPVAPTLQIGNTPDPFISFPDGTVARRSEVDQYIASLPEDQQMAARAKMAGLAPQKSPEQHIQDIGAANTTDDAISAFTAAVNAGKQWQELGIGATTGSLEQQRGLEAVGIAGQQWQGLQDRNQAERKGMVDSQARDARLADAGQAWQALGITDSQDDLQAQRMGMRGPLDAPTAITPILTQEIAHNQPLAPAAIAQPAIETVAPALIADPRLTPVSQRVTPEVVSRADIPNEQKPDATDQQVADVNEAEYQQSIKDGIKQRLGLVKETEVDQRKTPFKTFLREFGINPEHTSDIAGRNRFKANNILPATFRANGLSLDDLAERAIERGFMQEGDRGDQGKLVGMIQDEIAGKQQVSSEFVDDDAAAQHERVQRMEIEGMADAMGLPYSTGISTDVLASMVNRVERIQSQGAKAGTLKADRVKANALQTVARVERKRAEYAQQDDDFAGLTIAEQDALLEVLTDANGNPTISRKADAGTARAWAESQAQWNAQNGQADTTSQQPGLREDQAPSTGITNQGAEGAGQTSPQEQHRGNEVQGSAVESQESVGNAQQAPSGDGIFKLANGTFARFQDSIWWREKPTAKEALKTEFASENMAPAKRSDDQSWVPSHGFSLDEYGATNALRPLSESKKKELLQAKPSQQSEAAGQAGEGLTAPTRAEVEAKQDRAGNAQALDDKAQIDAETAHQPLTTQAAPEQRKDTSIDMFGEDKAKLEAEKREADAVAKNEASKDPNQGGMFDEMPAEPAAQATAILDAANVTGKERLDVLKDVKAGTLTAEEVKEAYPNQNKPATGNNGDFDASNPDIRYARAMDPAEAFRRMFSPPPASLSITEVQKAVDELSAKQKSGPNVKVVATPADLPIKAPRDARGLIHGDTIYIVASNHRTRDGVAQTFGHEVIGHYGLWRALGTDGTKQFEKNLQLAIKSGNVPLNKISQKVRRLYVDESGKFNLTPEQEANEIAAFAVEDAVDPVTGEFKTGYGFMKSAWAKVAQFLRDMGITIKFTNTELQGMLVNSMKGLEAGHRLDGGGQTMVAAAIGERHTPDVSDPRTGISTALLELGQNDDLYQRPRSDALELKDIADDKGGTIKVADVDKTSDKNEVWMLANTTPKDNAAQGTKSWMLTTPTGKLATLTKTGNEVYINVSGMGEGNGGSAVYDLAANYALNNGLVFVGDPNGVSSAAMRRRLENMLSSAIKYGTTDHLKPHPDQYLGNEDIGVPPLDWTNGDTLGNIRHMVDVSIASTEHLNPNATSLIHFDSATQSFVDGEGRVRGHEYLSEVLEFDQRARGTGQAGIRTLQRTALFKSLVQSEGARRVFLESVHRQQGSGGTNPSGRLEGTFYARGNSGAPGSIVGQTTRQHTPEQLRAMKNVGFDVEAPTLKERVQALWKDAGKKLAQGIADQFAPVKDLDKNAYAMLRLAKGASGAFEAFLQGGKLKLTNGVYDFDDTNKGGVIDKLLIPLQGEHHDFMRWVAANRAERLAGEGKENLFSAQDIADLKTLASGTTDFDYTIQTGPAKGRVTRDRTLIYADANRVFNEFNRNVLDMAEQSGLIDGASRNVWEHEFYVPFYRVADEDGGGVRGMSVKGSVLRQQAFKELKGGKNALNADLLDNTLMNWAHLLDAAAKNRAAKATIEAAERMGVATGGNQSTLASMGASIHNKNGVVWFMDGGQKRYSLIDNNGEGPYLMTALNALEYAGMRNPVMNAMGAMKHALTVGVTASPFFKIRNLIRDSVQAIGTGNLSYNPAANIAQGWKLTDPKSDAYFRLLAGGGTIHFGTMLEGSEAKRVQALVESGVDKSTILNDAHSVKAFYRNHIEPGVTAYNELGNRGEAINRAALYDQLVKQGMSHAEASLQARDLMDFSMQGAFTSIRFLTQVVPFLNARIQGLYKLGKSAKEDPARFGAVLGAVTMASLGLLAAYGDDDDWKKREEWDRNNFWWFKFGGQAFRIPKPFEIGAIATLAERGFELAFDKEMTNKRFMAQVMTLLGDNLSMNPVPQLVKPMLDVYANKDSFSGRPIETMGMDKLKSEYRFTDRTSMTARAISTGMNAVTKLAGKESLSPVQVDSMLRGYFGWLGSFIIGAADVLARPATGQSDHPSPDIWKAATGGMTSDLRDAPSRYVSQMYEQAKELEQAYGTWRALQKEGKTLEASEFYEANKPELAKYKNVEAVKRAEAKFNERIRIIERSNMDSDAKRDLIRSVQAQKDRVAHLVAA